ncbi:hypothetical protein V1264_013941 [Littorina saxatilis]|uniref:G-protein coupled receptors family 2 profile 1 domain-containing protein n=1 Tax=Littorina saxatilis TaxID=31220 RepID=A0AAN9GKG3_9CAEN
MEVACRDRFGEFNVSFFKLWSCSMCYTYLFHDYSPSFASQMPNAHILRALPSSPHPPGLTLQANVDDPQVVDQVCATLDQVACDKWTACCRAAEQCCKDQSASLTSQPPSFPLTQGRSVTHEQGTVGGISFRTLNPGGGLEGSETLHPHSVNPGVPTSPYAVQTVSGSVRTDSGFRRARQAGVHGNAACPSTWDGFGCFRATQAGDTATIACPSYIDQNGPHARAYKRCTENGTWWRTEETGQEWTDYTSCVQMETFRILYYVAVTSNAISLLLLVPACVIFLCFQ